MGPDQWMNEKKKITKKTTLVKKKVNVENILIFEFDYEMKEKYNEVFNKVINNKKKSKENNKIDFNSI